MASVAAGHGMHAGATEILLLRPDNRPMQAAVAAVAMLQVRSEMQVQIEEKRAKKGQQQAAVSAHTNTRLENDKPEKDTVPRCALLMCFSAPLVTSCDSLHVAMQTRLLQTESRLVEVMQLTLYF